MKRIIWHWTAGGHKANATDKRHYHFIIEGDGAVVSGNHAPEVNAHIVNPSDGSTYAAHTRGMNTGSIGVAVAAMRGAQDRPFSSGPSPITQAQVEALVKFTDELARRYGIPISRTTTLSHAEVEPTLGVSQRGKWDIIWLPDMSGVGDAVAVGDALRTRILDRRSSVSEKKPTTKPPLWALLKNLFNLLFGRK